MPYMTGNRGGALGAYNNASGYGDAGAGELGAYRRGTRRRGRSGYVRPAASALGAYLGDALPDYVAWTNQVNQNGGVVTNWPFSTDGSNIPAARYPMAVYTQLQAAGMIDPSAQQQPSGTGDYMYVMASDNVNTASQALTNVTAAEAANLPGGFSGWNPFANVSTTTKVMAGAAALTALAALAGMFRRA